MLAPSYFFVEGQTSRHGWCFTVSVASVRFAPVAFNSSEAVRKLCSVSPMSLFPESSPVTFSAFLKVLSSELPAPVSLSRFAAAPLTPASASFALSMVFSIGNALNLSSSAPAFFPATHPGPKRAQSGARRSRRCWRWSRAAHLFENPAPRIAGR